MSDMTIVALVAGAAFLAWAFIAFTFKERRERMEQGAAVPPAAKTDTLDGKADDDDAAR